MKLFATLIASVFAVSAFAAEPAKKEEKPAAKPAAVAPASAPSAPAKADTKSASAKDQKAEAVKK